MLHLFALHSRLQTTLTILFTILMLWGLVAALRGNAGPIYLALLWIAEWLAVAQALIGLVLFVAFGFPFHMAMHLIYGLLAVTLLPAAMLYARSRSGRHAALVYAFVSLLLMVVTMRAYETGAGA